MYRLATILLSLLLLICAAHAEAHEKSRHAAEKAIPLESRAGDVVVWDSRIWHGALPNRTEGTRWALIATWTRWWIKQFFDVTGTLPQEFYQKLTPSQKAMLGYCSIPWRSEAEGIDMKQGFDQLAEDVTVYAARGRTR